jgi:hypothetical protein
VLLEHQGISILSDPWFEGDAFHKGWNLLHENDPSDIASLLKRTTYIWISHEHPDHFSVKFFMKHLEILINHNIKILFQETLDRRVKGFLELKGLEVIELPHNKRFHLREDMYLTCIKDGFYDSGLLIEAGDDKILNLNDCEINTIQRANEVYQLTGPVDLLLTQFSYAAWKGGKNNIEWRRKAALSKIDTLKLQMKVFKPKFIVPFASYIYFSNLRNFYLNDCANTPQIILNAIPEAAKKIVFMKPMDFFSDSLDMAFRKKAVDFWEAKYQNLNEVTKNSFEKIERKYLDAAFEKYIARLKISNNFRLMRVLQFLSPVKIFYPIIIYLDDIELNIEINLFKTSLSSSDSKYHLSMSSESLLFLFENSFGFDTLTVNGCMEEGINKGFITATKTLAIDNLNNLGMNFSYKLLTNFTIIKIFLGRLSKVSSNMK